ncbi:MAG: hypothetical protein Q6K80_06720 [Thermostichus sp. DG_1_6_bins_120]
MAAPNQVKAYVACWLQLGKAVLWDRPAGLERLRPEPLLGLGSLSQEFQLSWQRMNLDPWHCYLEGTQESLGQLLSPAWEIQSCGRCGLPVPLPMTPATPVGPCPCSDLKEWPNSTTVPPRVQDEQFLQRAELRAIHQRLKAQDPEAPC